MRVIGGAGRGRRLLFPKKSPARPTSDRTKESLFNILSCLEGKVFLDIYAGAGSVGIEALSRGAAYVYFIERDGLLSEYIKKNLLLCGFTGSHGVMNLEVKKALALLKNKQVLFDIVFADPPYDAGLVRETLGYFAEGKLLAADGLLIMQHSVRETLPAEPANPFRILDQRKFGDTVLSFLKFHAMKGDL